jgi:ATP-dependent DNA helicase RecQ
MVGLVRDLREEHLAKQCAKRARVRARNLAQIRRSPVQMRKVRQLYAMLEGTACRPAAVRRYFGEEAVAACGQCDLCLNPSRR